VGENYGQSDFWIVKLYGSGVLQWEKNYGGSGGDVATSVQQTTDGGYIVAGESWSSDGDVAGNIEIPDIWIVKLDELGNLVWEKNYGGPQRQYAHCIQQTSDGGYIVAGSTGTFNSDYWIIKLDGQGNLVWEKNYGGSQHDRANSIQQTTDGGYIVAGESWSSDGDVGGNNGRYDYWVIKLDEQGNLVWEKNYGRENNDKALSIKQTTDGGYICTGTSNQYYGGHNFWIIKLDEVGNLEVDQRYGGSSSDYSYSIIETTSGDYVVAGSTTSNDGDICENVGSEINSTFRDAWILKLNGECLSTLEITEDTPFQNLYTSCGLIATSGNLVVEQNQQVQYCAHRVRLKEGFSVAAGADFKVRGYGLCD